jgi:hypothetical protein
VQITRRHRHQSGPVALACLTIGDEHPDDFTHRHIVDIGEIELSHTPNDPES